MSRHRSIRLEAVELGASITCDDAATRRYLVGHFGAMLADVTHPTLRYTVSVRASGFEVVREGAERSLMASDLGTLTYLLDSDLIVQLQLHRPRLLFLHAAAVADAHGAHLLVGRSGAGKSTACWGLLHRGLAYLSDELAPIFLRDATVRPFPRALSMKSAPPGDFPLPRGTVATSRGFDVPVHELSLPSPATSLRVRTLLFIDYRPTRDAPHLRPIGRAEAAARLYANVLNHLAHADDGLSAVLRVVAGTRSFAVDAAELTATCDMICDVISG